MSLQNKADAFLEQGCVKNLITNCLKKKKASWAARMPNILDDWAAIFFFFFCCSMILAATVKNVLNKLNLVCKIKKKRDELGSLIYEWFPGWALLAHNTAFNWIRLTSDHIMQHHRTAVAPAGTKKKAAAPTENVQRSKQQAQTHPSSAFITHWSLILS